MCGINGIYSTNNKLDKKIILAKMNSALAHRGPDDEGIIVQDVIGLGHRRLSIIDTSSAGHQPMTTADGRYTITYNGEIYNFRHLKQELNSYNFITNCDTEVILAAYLVWGAQCVTKFNGMFAFAIWDNLNKILFVTRDRLGIKPLYYYSGDNDFIFSSEIRALLASGCIHKKINHSALGEYLQYQTIHAPNTIVKDIKVLMPGNSILFKDGSIQITAYWKSSDYLKDNSNNCTYDECKTEVRNKLFASVERRMIADVPFGAFLSGGIDSSIIVAIMSHLSTQKIKTFSVNFEYEKFSEAVYSREISNLYKTEHSKINISAEDILGNVNTAISKMDHPTNDAINNYIISEKTKKAGITMALSGVGGDELFAGYDLFRYNLKLNKYNYVTNFPAAIRNFAGQTLYKIKPSVLTGKISALVALDNWNLNSTYPISREVFFPSEIADLLKSKYSGDNRVLQILEEIQQTGNWADCNLSISKITLAELSTYLPNILLRDTDQMSMANALEVRVPFLDHELVEYVLGLPDKYKYPHTPKKLLVDATKDLIPNSIVNRPKMGFLFPWSIWMRNELRDYCAASLTALAQSGMFHKDVLDMLWNRFLRNDPRVNWARIWLLVILQKWIENNSIEV